ncbi:mevalonate kinase [Angomonas deanei]|nr:mevalonate kinase [Angomonas deanei]|eukprot:EPY32450.1 mevalonate kinase [Angomonas deanei]
MPRAVKQQTTGKHTGYGKVILFGEHFVVHGSEAIVAGISQYTECSLELTKGKPGVEVIDNRPAVPGYIKEKRAEQEKAHQLVLDHLKIDTKTDGLRITIGGPLVPSSGIGASASDVVALSRALSELYGLNLTEEQVNNSAFVGEGGYHGTPSGVDNTAATFGGLISYIRKDGRSVFRKIKFSKTLYLVVIGTGITASTTKVVGDVRKLKEDNPKKFAQLVTKYNTVVEEAMIALQDGDLHAVGRLMNECHKLCVELTISCDELESIVNCCRENGALGAKLSGTGRGGIAVALVSSTQQRDRLVEALQKNCKEAKFIWKYSVTPAKKSSL